MKLYTIAAPANKENPAMRPIRPYPKATSCVQANDTDHPKIKSTYQLITLSRRSQPKTNALLGDLKSRQ